MGGDSYCRDVYSQCQACPQPNRKAHRMWTTRIVRGIVLTDWQLEEVNSKSPKTLGQRGEVVPYCLLGLRAEMMEVVLRGLDAPLAASWLLTSAPDRDREAWWISWAFRESQWYWRSPLPQQGEGCCWHRLVEPKSVNRERSCADIGVGERRWQNPHYILTKKEQYCL